MNVRTRGVRAARNIGTENRLASMNCRAIAALERLGFRSESTEKIKWFTSLAAPATVRAMFSHVVIFWTDPAQPNATEELLAGANKYLKPIPGLLHFHVGKMVGSHRPVVDQSYQVALNLIFPNKKAQDDYLLHPLHVEFVEKVLKRVCMKVLVYDFE